MPLYIVTQTNAQSPVFSERLVEAKSKARAVSFVANATISAEIAENPEIIRLTKAGVEVEQAG